MPYRNGRSIHSGQQIREGLRLILGCPVKLGMIPHRGNTRFVLNQALLGILQAQLFDLCHICYDNNNSDVFISLFIEQKRSVQTET